MYRADTFNTSPKAIYGKYLRLFDARMALETGPAMLSIPRQMGLRLAVEVMANIGGWQWEQCHFAITPPETAKMAQILIRGLSADVVDRLKARAQSHGRSVEAELRTILENASGFSVAQTRAVASEWQSRYAGRQFHDSGKLLNEDRGR